MLLDITTLAILDCIMFTVVLTLGAILISLAPDEEEVIEEGEEEVQMPTSGSIGKVFDHMANERLLEKKERGDLD
jgi:hypothetical protein